MDMSPDGRYLLVASSEEVSDSALVDTELVLVDLETGDGRPITSHGNDVQQLAFGPDGDIIVTGDSLGVVRVGRLSGGEPHLLLGHDVLIKGLALSADGNWIFSVAGTDGFQWPMPDLSAAPLHTLAREEFVEHLQAMTNLRAVPVGETGEGWQIEIGPFVGGAGSGSR